MDGQITIFEWLEAPKVEKCEHPLITKLKDDLADVFGMNPYKQSYNVWQHVPAYGKRYEAWFPIVSISENKFERMQERYKRHNLEISLCVTPSNLMISTVWLTNGHKEPLVGCQHTQECINYAYGCNGKNYWCSKY